MSRICFVPGCKTGYHSDIKRNKALGKKNPSLFSAPKSLNLHFVMEESSKKKKPNKKLTEKEIEEKRKKCRERVRKCREKMTDEKKAEKRAKDCIYKQKMKEAGVIKNINQLSIREQRMKRIQWKKDSCNYRKRQNIKKGEIVKESTTLGRKGSPRVQSGRKDHKLLEEWRRVIPRKDKVFTPPDKLCELHFEDDCILRNYKEMRLFDGSVFSMERERPMLKAGSVPTKFPSVPNNIPPNIQQRDITFMSEIKIEELDETTDQEELPYETLIDELNNIEKPDHWWTISHTLGYIICSKWNSDCSCERRVILFRDFSYKIFLRDVQISIEDTSIQNAASLTQLLQKVNKLNICQAAGSQKSDNCVGYVSEDNLYGFQYIYCSACKLLQEKLYYVQRKDSVVATKKNKLAQKLKNVERRNILLQKQLSNLKKKMQNLRLLYSQSIRKQSSKYSVTDRCKTNGEDTQAQLFKAEPTNQDYLKNASLIPTEYNKGIENLADVRNYIVVAEFLICNECK